jgi:hypothetical protein
MIDFVPPPLSFADGKLRYHLRQAMKEIERRCAIPPELLKELEQSTAKTERLYRMFFGPRERE